MNRKLQALIDKYEAKAFTALRKTNELLDNPDPNMHGLELTEKIAQFRTEARTLRRIVLDLRKILGEGA